jgi:hypothetical protein
MGAVTAKLGKFERFAAAPTTGLRKRMKKLWHGAKCSGSLVDPPD